MSVSFVMTVPGQKAACGGSARVFPCFLALALIAESHYLTTLIVNVICLALCYMYVGMCVFIRKLYCLHTVCRLDEDYVDISAQFYSDPSQWLSTHYPTTDSAPSHIVLYEGLMKVSVSHILPLPTYYTQTHIHIIQAHTHTHTHTYTRAHNH